MPCFSRSLSLFCLTLVLSCLPFLQCSIPAFLFDSYYAGSGYINGREARDILQDQALRGSLLYFSQNDFPSYNPGLDNSFFQLGILFETVRGDSLYLRSKVEECGQALFLAIAGKSGELIAFSFLSCDLQADALERPGR